jgi:uncharacterized protein (DUF4213/DUF364 family)
MALFDDLLASIQEDAPVRELRVCVRATAVWSRRLGLAYTFPRVHRGHAAEAPRDRLRDRSARELASLVRSDDSINASVGLAAINSLLDPGALELHEGNAKDLVFRRGEGKNVTVVGHFPFVDSLRERTRSLSVLELAPQQGDLPASEASRVIPSSEVVAITATSLINHTLEPLLELVSPDCFTIVLGPSTPLSPVLFDYGIDAIGGSVVEEPKETLLDVSEGASFRYTQGLRAVTAQRG